MNNTNKYKLINGLGFTPFPYSSDGWNSYQCPVTFFSPPEKTDGPAPTPGSDPANSNSDSDSDPENTNDPNPGDNVDEDLELTEEELAALPPKARKAYEKAKADAEAAAANPENETPEQMRDRIKKELEDERKREDRKQRIANAKKTGDKDTQITSLVEERDELLTRVTNLEAQLGKATERDIRLQACNTARLDPKYADRLRGINLKEFTDDAKSLMKDLGIKPKSPNLEGGDTSVKATPQQRVEEGRKQNAKNGINFSF